MFALPGKKQKKIHYFTKAAPNLKHNFKTKTAILSSVIKFIDYGVDFN